MEGEADASESSADGSATPAPFGELHLPMAQDLNWADVVRPRIPLVYLDLNHVIEFAKLQMGRPGVQHGHRRLLEAASRAVRERRAAFPLSAAHVWEILKISDPKQRDALVQVLEPLTGFNYMLGRVTLAQLELDAGIAAISGNPRSEIPLPLVRPTIGNAFGMVGGLKMYDESGREATARVRDEMGPEEFDQRMAALSLEFERQALRGPADQDVAELRERHGYRPEIPLESHDSRVGFERATSAILDQHPEWRRGRLRDFIAARELAHEWLDVINRALVERSQTDARRFDPSDVEMPALMAAMPHVQVAISMKTVLHRNPSHKWTANDVTDIDALSVAYAYCEAVLTDKAARNTLLASPELRPVGTFVPRYAEELADWLDALPNVPAPDMLLPHPLPKAPSHGGPPVSRVGSTAGVVDSRRRGPCP